MNLAGIPVIVFELALIVVAVLGFAWWQLRDLASARRQTQAQQGRADRADGASS